MLLCPDVCHRGHRCPSLDPISRARPVQSVVPHAISLRSVLLLFFYLSLDLPNGLFPSECPINILYAFFFSTIHITFYVHLIILDLITLITLGEECKLWSSSLCSFVQPAVASSLVGPIVLHSVVFSNTTNLCSSLNVRDQGSQPNNRQEKLK
jgi:hypothetical protein